MKSDHRIVTKLPLAEIWDEKGTIVGGRVRCLDEDLFRELVRTTTVHFLVADCGAELHWIPIQERFEFWKIVRPQVADPQKPIRLEEFPKETAYTDSEWRGRASECLILLEKHQCVRLLL